MWMCVDRYNYLLWWSILTSGDMVDLCYRDMIFHFLCSHFHYSSCWDQNHSLISQRLLRGSAASQATVDATWDCVGIASSMIPFWVIPSVHNLYSMYISQYTNASRYITYVLEFLVDHSQLFNHLIKSNNIQIAPQTQHYSEIKKRWSFLGSWPLQQWLWHWRMLSRQKERRPEVQANPVGAFVHILLTISATNLVGHLAEMDLKE